MTGITDAQSAYGSASTGLGIYSGLKRGGVAGTTSAALNAEKLASKAGVLGANTGAANTAAGYGSNALGIYSGLQQGGVAGNAGAAVNAAQLGSKIGAFGGASGAVGAAAGYVAAPLAVYNAVTNYQSGDTAGDAIRGAEAGAAIGSVVPVVGTLIGGVIGGAVGALSSAFGNGKVAAENAPFEAYTQAYKQDPSVASQVQNPYTALAGMFDLRSNQIKGTIPMYDQYGRMGEQQFVTDMTKRINAAATNGTIKPTDSAADIYNKAVAPWIASMGTWDDSNKGAMTSLLQQMTQQYVSGQAQSDWKSVGGQSTFSSLMPYQGAALPPSGAPASTLGAAGPQVQQPLNPFTGMAPAAAQSALQAPPATASGQPAPNNSSNPMAGLSGAALGAGLAGAASASSLSTPQANTNMSNDGSFDYGSLLQGLAPSLVGIGGSLIANNQANQGYNSAAASAKYNPTNSSTLGGQVQGQVGPNGQINYSSASSLAPQFNNFAQIANQSQQNAYNGMASGNPLSALPGQTQAAYNAADQSLGQSGAVQNAAGNNYLGAGNNVLQAFNNFDPNAYAQTQYNQLSALAAPGMTDQTQAMLNYEQASGRGGLTQNGQLGDIGGLNLSQNLANTNNALQATQNAQNYQSQLGQLASGLSGQGNSLVTSGQNSAINRFGVANQALQAGQGLNTSNLANANSAITGANGINQALLNQLQLSMYGSQGQASAGAQQGQFQAQQGQQNANSTGNLFGGLAQGLANQGGSFAGLGNLFGGSSYTPDSGWSNGANANSALSDAGFGDNYQLPPVDLGNGG